MNVANKEVSKVAEGRIPEEWKEVIEGNKKQLVKMIIRMSFSSVDNRREVSQAG